MQKHHKVVCPPGYINVNGKCVLNETRNLYAVGDNVFDEPIMMDAPYGPEDEGAWTLKTSPSLESDVESSWNSGATSLPDENIVDYGDTMYEGENYDEGGYEGVDYDEEELDNSTEQGAEAEGQDEEEFTGNDDEPPGRELADRNQDLGHGTVDDPQNLHDYVDDHVNNPQSFDSDDDYDDQYGRGGWGNASHAFGDNDDAYEYYGPPPKDPDPDPPTPSPTPTPATPTPATPTPTTPTPATPGSENSGAGGADDSVGGAGDSGAPVGGLGPGGSYGSSNSSSGHGWSDMFTDLFDW